MGLSTFEGIGIDLPLAGGLGVEFGVYRQSCEGWEGKNTRLDLY